MLRRRAHTVPSEASRLVEPARGGVQPASSLEVGGWVLLGLDAAAWVFWISISAWAIDGGEYGVANEGFLALAAPHTTIIPTLIAIISDLERHCRSQTVCSLETPRLHWYIFPVLVVPFDALTLAYNVRTETHKTAVIAASALSMALSVGVMIWSFVAGFEMWRVASRMPSVHAAVLETLPPAVVDRATLPPAPAANQPAMMKL
jgi:hypothetical protein